MTKHILLILSAFFLLFHPVSAQTIKTVGATGSDYATLKAAFDAVNAGSITGRIVFQIKDNTTETASAVLNGSGTGSSNYTSLKIYPIAAGKTISGSLNGSPLIDLSGADSVIIDGRVNQSGSTPDLAIVNSSASGGQTATIRLVNDASNNLITYTIIRGSATGLGIINIAGTSGITGNDNNTITYNYFTQEGGNRPVRALVANGTSAKENNNIAIQGNHFYNLINLNLAGGATILGITNNNEQFTISGNHFYETDIVSGTQNATCYIININGNGSNHSVTGNFIGGSAPECGGTALTKSNASNNNFSGITMMGSTNESNIQGNTIRNINWSNSGSANFDGIVAENSNVRIGTITGNIIGASDATGSITFTGGGAGCYFRGILLSGSRQITATGNSVGGITLNNQPTGDTDFHGIACNTSATTLISDNLIGSASLANSIQQTSVSTGSGNAQMCYGIYSTATSNVTISGNTIANLSNGASTSSTYVAGGIRGIYATAGTNSIIFNTIRNLTFFNRSAYTNANAPAIGISFDNSQITTAQTIRGNSISGIANNHPESVGHVIGILFSAGSTGHKIDRNFIRDISSSSSAGAKIFGISSVNGTNSYTNNIISIESSNPVEITGIYSAGLSDNLYFNTVYIGGAPVSGNAKSYAMLGMNLTRNCRNNIFSNFRSNSGTANGTHYAISLAGNNNLTINYNNYHVSGSGGVLGVHQNIDKVTLASWKTATGQDVNSLNLNPLYVSAGGSEPENYLPAESSLVAVTGTGTLNDYVDSVRSVVYPAIGAFEYTVAPCLNPVSGGTIESAQNICFNATPAPLTSLTLPTGQSGILEYQWQSSVDSVTFTNISAATNTGYSPGSLSQTTWYRRLARVSCKAWSAALASNIIKIGVATEAIYSISGRAAYENNPLTGLNGLKILLRKGATILDSAITGADGTYSFSQLTGGNYGLVIRSGAPGGQWQTWSGVNNTDYLLVSKHVAGTQLLPSEPPVVQTSASVKLPHPLINTADAIAIRQAAKFPATGWSYFDIPKWVFSGLTAATRIDTIVLACANVTRDIRGLCSGDVNGTFVPANGYKIAGPDLQLVNQGTLPVADEMIFPISVDRDMEIGAITLYLDFDPSVMVVTDVTDVTNLSEKGGEEPWFETKDGVLYIGWMSTNPVQLGNEEPLLLIHARLTEAYQISNLKSESSKLRFENRDLKSEIGFALNDNPLSELADGDGNVISGVKLTIPTGASGKTVKWQNGKEEVVSVYPNPAKEVVYLQVVSENESMLSVEIYNMLGKCVLKSESLPVFAGLNTKSFDVSMLPCGAYMMKVTMNDRTESRKVIVNR